MLENKTGEELSQHEQFLANHAVNVLLTRFIGKLNEDGFHRTLAEIEKDVEENYSYFESEKAGEQLGHFAEFLFKVIKLEAEVYFKQFDTSQSFTTQDTADLIWAMGRVETAIKMFSDHLTKEIVRSIMSERKGPQGSQCPDRSKR